MQRALLQSGLLVSSMLCVPNALSSPQEEIDHLIAFIGATSCQYERNGALHSGLEAVEHIKNKAEYHAEKIESAEDFIAYAATKSMFSGRHYKIHCQGDAPIESHLWLKAELDSFRVN
ncbi:DUF5329 family protein [Shewanella sp. 10N.286.54.B9]|uniref:DUF5329 family protein n=1 Tax=Shewanella sp. 10N.286.54.B9 TaxID=3229719 RepID=UPI00354BF4F1